MKVGMGTFKIVIFFFKYDTIEKQKHLHNGNFVWSEIVLFVLPSFNRKIKKDVLEFCKFVILAFIHNFDFDFLILIALNFNESDSTNEPCNLLPSLLSWLSFN